MGRVVRGGIILAVEGESRKEEEEESGGGERGGDLGTWQSKRGVGEDEALHLLQERGLRTYHMILNNDLVESIWGSRGEDGRRRVVET